MTYWILPNLSFAMLNNACDLDKMQFQLFWFESSDVVAEACAAPDRCGNRIFSKDQRTMFRSSLIEYLKRGRERGTTGTTSREARRNKDPETQKPRRKPNKKKLVPVEGCDEVEASNEEKAPDTLEEL
jgi:hypothetical protein